MYSHKNAFIWKDQVCLFEELRLIRINVGDPKRLPQTRSSKSRSHYNSESSTPKRGMMQNSWARNTLCKQWPIWISWVLILKNFNNYKLQELVSRAGRCTGAEVRIEKGCWNQNNSKQCHGMQLNSTKSNSKQCHVMQLNSTKSNSMQFRAIQCNSIQFSTNE